VPLTGDVRAAGTRSAVLLCSCRGWESSGPVFCSAVSGRLSEGAGMTAAALSGGWTNGAPGSAGPFGSVLAGRGEDLCEGGGGAAKELLECGVDGGEVAIAGGEEHPE